MQGGARSSCRLSRSGVGDGDQICIDDRADADEFRWVGHERVEEPPDTGTEDRQRRLAVLLTLPEVDYQSAARLQVDDDGPDVTRLGAVGFLELFQAAGRSGQLFGVERVHSHYGIHCVNFLVVGTSEGLVQCRRPDAAPVSTHT